MKQRDLLLAGLLLLGVPAFAQPDLSDPRSAKVVFNQDFEGNWADWILPFDNITSLEYYDASGHSDSPSEDTWSKWTKFATLRTDTVLPIQNGVVVIDDGEKTKSIRKGKEEIWGEESYQAADLKAHGPNTRMSDFDDFGENPGSTYFQFISDTVVQLPDNSNAYSNKLSARYRRNLFVRLNPGDIEENSSYRLTFYVRAKKLSGHEEYNAVPTIYADVMRGYFHSEKPFSMGYHNDANKYEYNKTFELTKNDFYKDKNWDNWEKVTMMTYYTTDSIADRFMMKDGYYWADDSAWYWPKSKNPTKDYTGDKQPYDLFYINQPNKFFVRLGFASDFTQFDIDNMSLTKSWIAGAEYSGDKMRINFGYKTNLAQLVAEEKARTGVDQLELPGTYFTVWCQKNDDSWEQMPMRSAEYHGDGYLYLFTAFIPGTDNALQFGSYKKVLVSFTNPVDDPKIALKYTDTPFPKGNDSTWIKGGKYVPDFVNEVAQKNPSQSVWKGVYSKYDLPPVMTKAPYEDGSFGLAPVKELKFKFSRKVDIDNEVNTSKAIAYVGSERWGLEWSASDSMLILKRENATLNPGKTGNLPAGDYNIQLVQLFGIGTDQAKDVVVNYNFGEMSRILSEPEVVWEAKFDTVLNSADQCLPEGTALTIPEQTGGSMWSPTYGNQSIWLGDGTVKDSNCRLYWFAGKYNRAYNLNSRGKNYPSRFYLGFEDGFEINFIPGNYSLNFAGVGINGIHESQIYLYKWDDEWATKPKNVLQLDEAEKVLVGTYTPSKQVGEGIRKANTGTVDDIDTIVAPATIGFAVEKAGRYVIEIAFNGGSQWSGYHGILLTSPYITKDELKYAPIAALNQSVDNAKERIKVAERNLKFYGGTLLNILKQKVEFYDYNPEGEFKDKKNGYPNEPSKWAAAKADLDLYINWVAHRIDTIDALHTKIQDANTKLSQLSADYLALVTTKKLQEKVDSAASATYNVQDSSGVSIDALTKRLDAAMTAIDDRVKLNDALKDAISAAEKALGDKEAATTLAEYKSLQDTLDAAKKFDAITSIDSLVNVQTDKLKRVTVRYTSKIESRNAQTARLKGLRVLAKDLGSDVAGIWALNNFVDTTQVDNDEIAEIYKTAVKLAIYERAAIDPTSLDGGTIISPFLKNYNLYTSVSGIVDRYDKSHNSVLPSKNSAPNDPYKVVAGDSLQKVSHQYDNNKAVYVLVLEQEYKNSVYPGWTVKSFDKGAGKHCIVSPDDTGDYPHLGANALEFDGRLAIDWNSKAELTGTSFAGLPAGLYAIGVDVRHNRDGGSTVVDLKAKVEGKNYATQATYTSTTTETLLIDSVPILNGVIDTLYLSMNSGDGPAFADNFSLEYISPLDESEYDVVYADSIDALTTKLDNMIKTRKTMVNTPKAAAASVEYYTVGGQKLVAPRRGEIIIRKTTQANGKVVVEKIILK